MKINKNLVLAKNGVYIANGLQTFMLRVLLDRLNPNTYTIAIPFSDIRKSFEKYVRGTSINRIMEQCRKANFVYEGKRYPYISKVEEKADRTYVIKCPKNTVNLLLSEPTIEYSINEIAPLKASKTAVLLYEYLATGERFMGYEKFSDMFNLKNQTAFDKKRAMFRSIEKLNQIESYKDLSVRFETDGVYFDEGGS